jgi:hypothetical protein
MHISFIFDETKGFLPTKVKGGGMFELENIRHPPLESASDPLPNGNDRPSNHNHEGQRRTHQHTVRTVRQIFETGRAQ